MNGNAEHLQGANHWIKKRLQEQKDLMRLFQKPPKSACTLMGKNNKPLDR